MSCKLYMLTEQQTEHIAPYFPKSRGWPRVDCRLVLSGIIHFRKLGNPWDQAPSSFGHWAALYRRFDRWTSSGVFQRILTNVAMDEAELAIFDSTCCKAHRNGVEPESWTGPLTGKTRNCRRARSARSE